MISWTHVLAIVVGTARPDADAYTHFGSMLGFGDHLTIAVDLGLVEVDDSPEIVITDAGRAFVQQFNLTELPMCRANYWPANHPKLVQPAFAELSRRRSAYEQSKTQASQKRPDVSAVQPVDWESIAVRLARADGSFHLLSTHERDVLEAAIDTAAAIER